MIICQKCKREMKCIKNGINYRWNGSHCYTGDLFKCGSCGVEVGSTNATPNNIPVSPKTVTDNDVFMDNWYEDNFTPKKPNVNFRRKNA